MCVIYFSINKLKSKFIKNAALSSLHCSCRRSPVRINASRAQIILDMLSRATFLVAVYRLTMDSYIYRLLFYFINVESYGTTCLEYG